MNDVVVSVVHVAYFISFSWIDTFWKAAVAPSRGDMSVPGDAWP